MIVKLQPHAHIYRQIVCDAWRACARVRMRRGARARAINVDRDSFESFGCTRAAQHAATRGREFRDGIRGCMALQVARGRQIQWQIGLIQMRSVRRTDLNLVTRVTLRD